MKTIELTKGFCTMVDDQDFEWLNQFTWCVSDSGNEKFYAYRKNGDTTEYMHRLIGEKLGYTMIDHKDRNGLNNQRENLRQTTKSKNALNVKHKGYTITPAGNFRAQLKVNGKHVLNKVFKTQAEAQAAYEQMKQVYL